MHRIPLSCPLFLAAVATLPALAAQPPSPIADLALGLKVLPTHKLDLGVACDAIRDSSGNPYVLWVAAGEGSLPVPQDRARAVPWLRGHARALGYGDFQPVFLRNGEWRGCEVWTYGLVRDGITLFDAEVSLYWQGKDCIGMLNRCPRIARVAAADAAPPADAVYYARRDDTGDVLLAALRRTTTATHHVTEVVHGTTVVHRILEQRRWSAAPLAATITEYTFPGMNFPDQIWADSKGLIWFSEPSANRLSVFDPTANAFRQYPTTGYTLPDGMIVDDQDRVWTGLYGTGNGLGMLDIPTGQFTRFAPPYANAQMAIPNDTGFGTFYVTDHFAERISEFDPKTRTWVRQLTLPSPSYPVGGVLEPETGDSYFPLYYFHGLGRLSAGQQVVRIAAPSRSGPAFAGVHDGKVYFTYWSANKLGEYDTKTNSFTEYLWRAGELGGPMFMAHNGHAVVGTRSRGYIAIFDPVTRTFTDYVIPTSSPGLKDGLTVAPDGVIWFTESGVNKIAKLVLP